MADQTEYNILSQFPEQVKRAEELARRVEWERRQSYLPDLPADGTDPRWYSNPQSEGR